MGFIGRTAKRIRRSYEAISDVFRGEDNSPRQMTLHYARQARWGQEVKDRLRNPGSAELASVEKMIASDKRNSRRYLALHRGHWYGLSGKGKVEGAVASVFLVSSFLFSSFNMNGFTVLDNYGISSSFIGFGLFAIGLAFGFMCLGQRKQI